MRKLWDFHGGIQLPTHKAPALSATVRTLPLPARLVLPLRQHRGAPARPIVVAGQQVLKGQLLAAPDGETSVALHAPTSGIIEALIPEVLVPETQNPKAPVHEASVAAELGDQTTLDQVPASHAIAGEAADIAAGGSAPALVLRADGLDRWTTLEPCADWRGLSPATLLEKICAAGIAGLGGAGFPTAIKLTDGALAGASATLILNGAECEPYISADDALMRTRPEAVIAGAEILARLVGAGEVLLAVEDDKPKAIAALAAAADDRPVEVVPIPTRYPSGGERQLIKLLTGREVPSGGLPRDVGVVCQNVATAAAVADAIIDGRPLISRVTTIAGDGCAEPGNYEVLLGTPVAMLLAAAGADASACRLVMGGPMMGRDLDGGETPLTKTSNCVLALAPAAPVAAQPCIRCGLCADVCPAQLLPQQLYWFARSDELDKAAAHRLFDCIECGACSYVCPSAIPLVDHYRHAKAAIREQREAQAKACHAKARFEARQARLAAEAAAQEARRQARLAAAKTPAATSDDRLDPIQAAIARARLRKAEQAVANLQRRLARSGSEPGNASVSAAADLERQLTAAQAELDQARVSAANPAKAGR